MCMFKTENAKGYFVIYSPSVVPQRGVKEEAFRAMYLNLQYLQATHLRLICTSSLHSFINYKMGSYSDGTVKRFLLNDCFINGDSYNLTILKLLLWPNTYNTFLISPNVPASLLRYSDGQLGPLPPVCHLHLLLNNYGPDGEAVWDTNGLPCQCGLFPTDCLHHVLFTECCHCHCFCCSDRLPLLGAADPALHAGIALSS